MTTDPATVPAEQVPTREEIARKLCRLPGSLCIGFCHRQNCQEAIAVYGDAADAIIALYAPHIAKLEKERDEAREGREAYVKIAKALIAQAEAALATAYEEGMREAAEIAADWDNNGCSAAILAAIPK